VNGWDFAEAAKAVDELIGNPMTMLSSAALKSDPG
jgi:hypothetical protein